MVTATKLPFSKLKPGMWVHVTCYDEGYATGRLLDDKSPSECIYVPVQ